MDVNLDPKGKPGCFVAIVSWGLVPMMLKSRQKTYPAKLDETGMTLRNGQVIPWSSFKRIHVTDATMGRGLLSRTYELWHQGGKIFFVAHHIQDVDAVVKYIVAHLPPGTEGLKAA